MDAAGYKTKEAGCVASGCVVNAVSQTTSCNTCTYNACAQSKFSAAYCTATFAGTGLSTGNYGCDNCPAKVRGEVPRCRLNAAAGAGYGGAIYIRSGAFDGTSHFTNVTFEKNGAFSRAADIFLKTPNTGHGDPWNGVGLGTDLTTVGKTHVANIVGTSFTFSQTGFHTAAQGGSIFLSPLTARIDFNIDGNLNGVQVGIIMYAMCVEGNFIKVRGVVGVRTWIKNMRVIQTGFPQILSKWGGTNIQNLVINKI